MRSLRNKANTFFSPHFPLAFPLFAYDEEGQDGLSSTALGFSGLLFSRAQKASLT